MYFPIPLSFLFQLQCHFYLADSSCLTHHYSYDDGVHAGKCFIIMKRAQIRTIRRTDVIWRDSETVPQPEWHVVRSRKEAESACAQIHNIYQEAADVLTDDERQEVKDFSAMAAVIGKSVSLFNTHADGTDDPALIKWLLGAAYRGSRYRLGGGSFTQLRLGFNVDKDKKDKQIGNVPNNTQEIMKTYKPGDCGMIFFDAGRPDQQGVHWVDCENPYLDGADKEHKSFNVICEYKAQKDCKWVDLYPKCMLSTQTFRCMWYDFLGQDPKDPLGKDCPGEGANRTLPCPYLKRHECNKSCTWSEWSVRDECKPCPKPKSGSAPTILWKRTLLQEGHIEVDMGGSQVFDCDDSKPWNVTKSESCVCGADTNRFFGRISFVRFAISIGCCALAFASANLI